MLIQSKLVLAAAGFPAEKKEARLQTQLSLSPRQMKLFEVHALRQVDLLQLRGEDGQRFVMEQIESIVVRPAI